MACRQLISKNIFFRSNILLFCYHGNIPNKLTKFTKVKTFATIAIIYIFSPISHLKMGLEQNALGYRIPRLVTFTENKDFNLKEMTCAWKC